MWSLRRLHISVFLVLSGHLQLMASEVRALPYGSHPSPMTLWLYLDPPNTIYHLCSPLPRGLGCAVITFEWQDNRMQVYTAP